MNRQDREKMLRANNFIPLDRHDGFCDAGQTWQVNERFGSGWYWVYQCDDRFALSIHDFSYHQDITVEWNGTPFFGVSWYRDVSAFEFSPPREIRPGSIRSHLFGTRLNRCLMRGRAPLYCVTIEFTPHYCESQLASRFPKDYQHPGQALQSIDDVKDFPEMELLLRQVADFRGVGMAAHLFYEGAATHALSLIYLRHSDGLCKQPHVNGTDVKALHHVTQVIEQQLDEPMRLEYLAREACMGATKLKKSFRAHFDCTITEYIQRRRMARAELLLITTSLPIAHVARTVGYTSASRFSELFLRLRGISPSQYRKLA